MRRAANIQPKGLPCGIYFGLPEERYRADPALNYSGMKDLLEGAAYYWSGSPLNPDWKPKKPTDEQRIGTALHTLLLEPEKFARKYYDPLNGFDSTRLPIRSSDYEWMSECVAAIRAEQELDALLKNGRSEVSIIWADQVTSVRLKARHDYWKPFCSVDYKSAYGAHNGAIRNAFWKYRYDIQSYHYQESRSVIRSMLKSGTADVYGKNADMRMIDRFIGGEVIDGEQWRPMDNFVFIFQMKEAPYGYRIFQPSDATIQKGQTSSDEAIALYCSNLEVYGCNKWPACSGKIEVFDMSTGFMGE